MNGLLALTSWQWFLVLEAGTYYRFVKFNRTQERRHNPADIGTMEKLRSEILEKVPPGASADVVTIAVTKEWVLLWIDILFDILANTVGNETDLEIHLHSNRQQVQVVLDAFQRLLEETKECE
jgi:hypothetical protein